MTGLEPQTSGIGSDHSTNWATTTAHKRIFLTLSWISLTHVNWMPQISSANK